MMKITAIDRFWSRVCKGRNATREPSYVKSAHCWLRLLGLAMLALLFVKGAAAQTTFTYTGSVQTYTVPAGAVGIQINALGAGGGGGGTDAGGNGGAGGAGGSASGIYSVAGGTVINVAVGGGGGPGSTDQTIGGTTYTCTNAAGSAGSAGGTGGFAGGSGGEPGCSGWSGAGGGGGGASVVASAGTTLIVAGGGSGGQGGAQQIAGRSGLSPTTVGTLPGSAGSAGSQGPSDGGGGGGGGGGCPGGAGGAGLADLASSNNTTQAAAGGSCSNTAVTAFSAVTAMGGGGGAGGLASNNGGINRGSAGTNGSVTITPIYPLQVNKTWSVNSIAGNTITVATTGATSNATIATSVATAAGNSTLGTAGGIKAGDTVTFPAETFTNGSAANYTTTVACTGNTNALSGSAPGSTLVISSSDKAITCTYTNTPKTATLTLKKIWAVNSNPGNSITFTGTGGTNTATTGVSTATALGNTTTGTAATVTAGNAITLAETFGTGSAANYTSVLSCTGNATPLAGNVLTVNASDTAIVCTETNTPKTASLKLVKTWAVNSIAGNSITATTTGGTNNASTGTSIATAAGNTTTGTAVTVSAGNTITFPQEVFSAGSQSNYSTTLSCTGNSNALSGSAPGSTLLISASDTAITCTYTNTPKTASLTLKKTWAANSIAGDSITFAGTGGTNTATTGVSTATALGNTTTGTAATVTAGNAITLAETFGTGSAGNYNSVLNCTGNATPLAGNVLTVNASDTAIVCTETNTAKGSQLIVQVFGDNGSGGGTANDGAQNGSEAGLGNVVVTATAGGSTVANATTNASGTAVLWLPFGVSGTVVVTPTAPSGYLVTGGSAGNTGGTYSRPSASVASVSFTYASGNSYTGVNFGLVPPNTLAPDGAQTAQPGTTVFYPHSFMADSAGQVTFSTSGTASPALTGWSEVLYRDTSCSGQFSNADPQITAPITATAGQQICILVKEFVPANAPLNAQNKLTVSASFAYSGSAAPATSVLTRTDTTTVGSSGGLQLTKQVQNITTGGSYGTANNAAPGNTLQYQLSITNLGSGPLSTVVLNDSTPAFTTFLSAACPAPATLPAGLTACSVSTQPAVGGQGALQWTFTGTLAPGSQTSVTFQAQVAQ
ncbi:MAG: hypothetical protein P4L96_17365 [Rhodoferax sp.]|nr:hypothetical protein [Rhodoferax sp.]